MYEVQSKAEYKRKKEEVVLGKRIFHYYIILPRNWELRVDSTKYVDSDERKKEEVRKTKMDKENIFKMGKKKRWTFVMDFKPCFSRMLGLFSGVFV